MTPYEALMRVEATNEKKRVKERERRAKLRAEKGLPPLPTRKWERKLIETRGMTPLEAARAKLDAQLKKEDEEKEQATAASLDIVQAFEGKLDPNQRGMSRWWAEVQHKYRFGVVNASRQIGKSWWALTHCCMEGFKNKNWQIKYGAPSKIQTRGIVMPTLRMLFAELPEELRPKWQNEDSLFLFPNNSTLTIIACDEAKAENITGQHAHLFMIDEGGQIDNLDFIARAIALPMTLNTKGRIIIFSTPARTKGSSFKAWCDEAKSHGTYLERDIYDNPRITDEEIREMCEACGGPDSTTWKREYLVQHVTDETTAVLPEATEERLQAITMTDAVLSATRSPFVDPYVSIMPGWNPDVTGVVWGHFDFRKNRIVMEDNLVMKRTDTLSLSSQLAERQVQLWGEVRPYRSLGPIDDKIIVELSSMGHAFSATPQEMADVDIGKLRHSITHKRGPPLYIHERCTDLARQMGDAVWDLKRKRQFDASPTEGRYQLVTAAIYLRREINERHDPTPRHLAMHPAQGLYIPLIQEKKSSPLANTVRKLFGVRR